MSSRYINFIWTILQLNYNLIDLLLRLCYLYYFNYYQLFLFWKSVIFIMKNTSQYKMNSTMQSFETLFHIMQKRFWRYVCTELFCLYREQFEGNKSKWKISRKIKRKCDYIIMIISRKRTHFVNDTIPALFHFSSQKWNKCHECRDRDMRLYVTFYSKANHTQLIIKVCLFILCCYGFSNSSYKN